MTRKTAIFSPTIEYVNLALGVTFTCISLIQWIFFPHWMAGEPQYYEFIIGTLFFNAFHVMSTYVNCLVIEEYKAVCKTLIHPARLTLLALMLFIIYLIYTFGLFNNPIVSLTLILVTFFLPIHHILRQSHGLSLLYNQKFSAQIDEGQRPHFVACERQSRRMENLACWLAIMGASLGQFAFMPESRILFAQPGNVLKPVSAVLVITALIVLLMAIFRFKDGEFIRHKLIFHFRFLIRILTPFASSAYYAGNAIHGTEYFLLQLDIQRKLPVKAVRHIWALSLPFFLFMLCIAFPEVCNRFVGLDLTSSRLGILKSATMAISLLHYHLDSVLFKMSHPVCRKHIGSLLTAEVPAEVPGSLFDLPYDKVLTAPAGASMRGFPLTKAEW